MTAFLLKCNRFMITGTFRLPPNPEAFLNREAFVQLVKEKLQLYQLNESQLAAVYENYTCPMNDDLFFLSNDIICGMTLPRTLLSPPALRLSKHQLRGGLETSFQKKVRLREE